MTYTSHHDMYGVIFRFNDHQGWQFCNHALIVSKSDIEKKGYTPNMYLCKDMEEAKKMWFHIVSTYKEHLAEIKISVMNRYNLESESLVLQDYYMNYEKK